jgi:hypothetical protein
MRGLEISDRKTGPRRGDGQDHASRILTDQASLAFLCAVAASRHFKAKFKDQVTLATRVQECLDLGKPIMDAFYGSQKEFYESYGYKFSDRDA